MQHASQPRSPLGSALLWYFLAMTAVITLAPFRFQVADELPLSVAVSTVDVAGNVFLFLPLGFLYRATRGGSIASIAGRGFVLSLLIESVQIASRGRFFSPIDLLTNTAGAALGAVAHRAVQDRLQARLAGMLALELPLMSVVYLLVPLLWLDGLAASGSSSRSLLAPMLGVCGGAVLVSVWRNRLRPSGVLSAAGLGWVAAAWFLAAGLPGLLRSPMFLLVSVASVGLATWLQAERAGPPEPERRFEIPTLRRVAPLFAGYLVLLALWPWTLTPSAWRLGVGFLDLRDEPGPLPLLRLVEAMAAFTLLGYVVAEYRSRREEGVASAAGAAAVASLAVATLLELARGFHPAYGASLLRAGILALSGGGGAAVFVQLRDSVRRWLTRSAAPRRDPAARPAERATGSPQARA